MSVIGATAATSMDAPMKSAFHVCFAARVTMSLMHVSATTVQDPAVDVTYGTVTTVASTNLGVSAPVPLSQEGPAIVVTFGTVTLIAMHSHVQLLQFNHASVATLGTGRMFVLTAKF
jgi:hypothetical protein